ncbi:MAG TPA: alpha/beta hydrolase [Candidatus Binataceae bacterium]|nr:alpha/beta hydrolase [Candidatus Binataceae bacterium]
MDAPVSGFTEGAARLHYLEWNRGARDCVVLVHGNSANAWWWVWVAEAMGAAAQRIVALDLRGHGDSDWVKPPNYSPLAYADDIARLIRALELERPVVVGHSMGGVAALAFAMRFAKLARGLVAIDVAVTSTARRNRYLRHLKALPTVVYPDLATAIERFRLMPKEGEIAPEIMRAVAEHSLVRTANGGFTMKFDRESFFGSDGLDVASAISQIEMPLLLVRAGHSRILTAEAAAAAVASNPRARLETIADAHHHIPLERPAELAQVLKEFIETHPEASSG